MSLVASCQIPPTSFLDSFQSSLSRFHGYRLQMFRYLPSNPSRKHHNSLIQTTLNPNSHQQKPTPNSTFEPQKGQNAKRNQSLDVETSVPQSQHWIDGWSKTQLQNLPKRPQLLRDYRNVDDPSEEEEEEEEEEVEEDNEISPRSSSTMDRIVEKLKRYGYVDGVNDGKAAPPERGSVEDIFYVEEGTLPNSRGGFSSEYPLGMHTGFGDGQEEVRFPWEKKPAKEEGDAKNSLSRNRSKTSLAELTLPESELRRLRHSAIRTKERTKIGGAGVTHEIVDKIHEKWKSMEVVRLKCEGAPALNMKRMHEILERKSGGLVIWRSGTSISLYRGVGYELPSMQSSKKQLKRVPEIGFDSLGKGTHMASMDLRGKSLDGNIMREAHESSKAIIEVKSKPYPLPDIDYDSEIDKLLDGLGPRYNDWPGDDLLPVDADLLPGVVPGYKAPFRILPYGMRPTLSNKDMTALRRLARVLPPHFALGRSRQHQGLAMAMAKLWERSSVAKIALKRGVQLTTSERMAEDIKKLTGATLLTRNKDYIVFYRGKDFLSPELTEALMERERLAKTLQDEEEHARLRASSSVVSNIETIELSGPAGTLAETLEADARWGKRLDDEDRDKILRSAEAARHADLVRKLEKKLYLANRKLMKAEKALNKVEEFLKPAERPADPESVSDEERFMFRKLGLRMKAFLLLGRRGVFDGTVENMHLHWKYRELVKIIVKEKNFAEVKKVALSLESESGGVLISVDKISKGYAIIVFRGQDYKRPPILRPKNLLTKRKALARSIELQRHEALSNHISTLHKKAGQLRAELDQMETLKGQGDDELYAKLDSIYPNEDEDTEDEGDEAYLETYNHDDDEDDFQLGSLVNENYESSSNM